MSDPVLQIKAKKYGGESTVISMRLPKDMLRDIDLVAEATGRTRNDILAMSLEFALKHLEIQKIDGAANGKIAVQTCNLMGIRNLAQVCGKADAIAWQRMIADKEERVKNHPMSWHKSLWQFIKANC